MCIAWGLRGANRNTHGAATITAGRNARTPPGTHLTRGICIASLLLSHPTCHVSIVSANNIQVNPSSFSLPTRYLSQASTTSYNRFVTVAALFVLPNGPYSNLEGVDAWGEDRDARLYAGPWPVVAHPPCARWGRYWYGGPSAKERKIKGDDAGCFASALASVRQYGGVLEHPAASAAWEAFDLYQPWRNAPGGWTRADRQGGWTCMVDQEHYGHQAQKATWLYAGARRSTATYLDQRNERDPA